MGHVNFIKWKAIEYKKKTINYSSPGIAEKEKKRSKKRKKNILEKEESVLTRKLFDNVELFVRFY